MFDSRSVVEAVNQLAGRFARAPKIRRLPRQVLPARLASWPHSRGGRPRWHGRSVRLNGRCFSMASIC